MSDDIDIGQISEALNDKMDRDAGNPADLGKVRVSEWGMPSNTYDDLTLGASGAEYTSTSNGWVFIGARSGGTDGYINTLGSTPPHIQFYESRGFSAGAYMCLLFPVKKSDKFIIRYNNIRGTNPDLIFRFIYAGGEV